MAIAYGLHWMGAPDYVVLLALFAAWGGFRLYFLIDGNRSTLEDDLNKVQDRIDDLHRYLLIDKNREDERQAEQNIDNIVNRFAVVDEKIEVSRQMLAETILQVAHSIQRVSLAREDKYSDTLPDWQSDPFRDLDVIESFIAEFQDDPREAYRFLANMNLVRAEIAFDQAGCETEEASRKARQAGRSRLAKLLAEEARKKSERLNATSSGC